ncbi:MAG: IS1380 family transposase, partial [Muribaculaceae bacterium]|nr:IS1380 family transposase [Muribaculaceae bacterium]
VPGLSTVSRLKKFIFTFLTVPAKWIRSGRRHILNIHTNRTFYPAAFAT